MKIYVEHARALIESKGLCRGSNNCIPKDCVVKFIKGSYYPCTTKIAFDVAEDFLINEGQIQKKLKCKEIW